MDSQTIFAALRDALAELYPGEADAQAVVTAAVGRRGLRRAQPSRSRTVEAKPITFRAPVQTNWQQILIAVINEQRLDVLLEAANKAYGENPALRTPYEQYQRFIEQGNRLEAASQLAVPGYQQALAIAKEIGNRSGEGIDLDNLGSAYRNLGQVDKAIESHQQALAIDKEIGDRSGEGIDLDNLGNAYAALGQAEKALTYFQQVPTIHKEINDRSGEGADLGNLGSAYAALEQVEQARQCLEQALQIFEEIKSPNAETAREQLEALKAQ